MSTTLFVKGFAQRRNYSHLEKDPSTLHGNFLAIVTDLVTTNYIFVKSAVNVDGNKWVLECTDGTTITLLQEPTAPKELVLGQLVHNFTRDFLNNPNYDVVSSTDFDEAAEAIENGIITYRLIGLRGGQKIVTSKLLKFWVDPHGVKHGLTKSGSHYVF